MEDKNIKTVVINLFGSPGTGKSTTASQLFYLMKTAGYDVELVSEFAKDLVWESRVATMKNQIYIFGKQHHRLHRLKGQVKYIVTDCPLLLSEFYNREYNGGSPVFYALVKEEIEKHNNLNIFLNRKKDYVAKGRTQNEQESDAIAVKLRELLDETGYEYHTFDAFPNVGELIFDLIKKIETDQPILKSPSLNDELTEAFDFIDKQKGLTKIPSYSDIFTIQEFIESVECHSIMDDDGHGYLSKDGKNYYSNAEVCCHLDMLEANKNAGYTHVVWFNK